MQKFEYIQLNMKYNNMKQKVHMQMFEWMLIMHIFTDTV